jgi:GntR family transcriptional repressor for pyruvate dehydrogenase complex
MVEYNSLVDKIAGDLQEKILRGELKPGARLSSERSLCSVYGVGRTTVREAMKSLAVRGLVKRAGRGLLVVETEFLTPPGADLASLAAQTTIRQLFEVRKLMEVRVAGWAAARATAEDIDALRAAAHVEHLAENTNRMFHDALARAAHNPAWLQVYETGRALFFRLPFYWKLFGAEEVKTVRAWRHELARRWHEQIFRAIEQRDSAEAEGAMFQHLDIMEKDLLIRLQAREGNLSDQKVYRHPLLSDADAGEKNDLSPVSLAQRAAPK